MDDVPADPVPEVTQNVEEMDAALLANEVLNADVIEMDDLTDNSVGNDTPSPAAFEEPPVQIVDFPDFNNLQPVIHAPEDEIQVVDLLGFLNPGDPYYQDPLNHDMFFGFTQIQQPNLDPAFASLTPLNLSSSCKPQQSNPEAFRLWVRFFSQQDSSFPSVIIPDAWLSFFYLYAAAASHL